MSDRTLTRRQYLTMEAMRSGCGPYVAQEAVSSTALEHPEWDMDETRTLAEWEASR